MAHLVDAFARFRHEGSFYNRKKHQFEPHTNPFLLLSFLCNFSQNIIINGINKQLCKHLRGFVLFL